MVATDKIPAGLRDYKTDVIGVSGLITPSLDEMVRMLKEMGAEKFTMPLLIGGTTTVNYLTMRKD